MGDLWFDYGFTTNDIIFKLQVKHEMIHEYRTYHHFGDIFSKLGGYSVLIEKVILLRMAPFTVLAFLLTLASIIRERYVVNYKAALLAKIVEYAGRNGSDPELSDQMTMDQLEQAFIHETELYIQNPRPKDF